MAMQTQTLLIGADVSKAEIVFCIQGQTATLALKNDRGVIRRWLRSFADPLQLAVEATNTFHLALVEEAHALDHAVYVVDGYRLSRYRQSVGVRAKTDRTDAELLLRYLEREGPDLRRWTPPPAGYASLQRLLHRRAALVQARTSLVQSLGDLPELKLALRGLLRQLALIERLIHKHMAQVAEQSGVSPDIRRCAEIEGIGTLTATALANAFRRGAFSCSDAFIAFLGLDVRVCDSGTYRGRRKLTKKGDSELRRLLFNAAMAARRSVRWRPVYDRHLQRGLKPTQILVILSRKLARIAFALMKNQSEYLSEIPAAA
jgi:transposase